MLAAVISDKLGRRWSFIICSSLNILHWLTLYYANDITTIITARTIGAIAFGALFALKICTTSEFVSPDFRGLHLNLVSTLSPAIGYTISHALGNTGHWKTVGLIGIAPLAIGIVLIYFWTESPHWLASKGNFKECEDAFRILHGSTDKTEEELKLLIQVEKTKLTKAEEIKSNGITRKLFMACKRRYFWDLMLLSVVIYIYLTAAGKLSFNALAVVIIEEMTGTPDIFFFTLVVDGFIIVGSSISCFLITKMSMRNMLFTTSLIDTSVLIILSVCMYFKSNNVIFQWIGIILLSVYFLILKSGPYPVLEALIGEIYPLELKMHFFCITGILLTVFLSLNILLLPYIVSAVGYHGMFFLNAVIMLVSLAFIWWRLPETKGRTLHEIEIFFKAKSFQKVEEKLNKEQITALI